MRISIFIGIGLCMLLSQSCLNVVPFDLPPAPRRLAINGLFSPQYPLRIQVSRSLPTDTLIVFQPELGAEVSLWQGGSRLAVADSLFLEGGFLNYTTTAALSLEPEIPYTVRVISAGGDTATATDVIPSAPDIRRVQLSDLVITPSQRRVTVNNTVTLIPQYSVSAMVELETVPNDQISFFGIRVFTASDLFATFPFNGTLTDSLYEVQMMSTIEVGSRGLRDEFLSYPFENDWVFTVDSGQAAILISEVSVNILRQNTPPDSLRLELWKFSPAFYQYQVDYTEQEALGQDPFAQPVNVPGNVNGGYGIWGGYQIKSITIALE